MIRLATVAIVVPDYDAGLAFYRDALGFALKDDIDMGQGKRWVVLSSRSGADILLAKAASGEQTAAVGHQTGGRVGFFLETNDFAATHAAFLAKSVHFEEAPRTEPYGTVAVFQDPWGNRWDLLERKPTS